MAVFKPKTRKMVTVNRGGTIYQREQEVNVDQPSAANAERLGRIPQPYVSKLPRKTNIDAVATIADAIEEARLEREAYFDHRLQYDEAFSQDEFDTHRALDKEGRPRYTSVVRRSERIEIPRDDSRQPGDKVQIDGKWYTIDNRLSEDYVESGERSTLYKPLSSTFRLR